MSRVQTPLLLANGHVYINMELVSISEHVYVDIYYPFSLE